MFVQEQSEESSLLGAVVLLTSDAEWYKRTRKLEFKVLFKY